MKDEQQKQAQERRGRALAALTFLLSEIRPEWDRAAIQRAVEQAQTGRTLGQVALACMAAAEKPDVRTPAVIPRAGDHWHAGDPIAKTPIPPPYERRRGELTPEITQRGVEACRAIIAERKVSRKR